MIRHNNCNDPKTKFKPKNIAPLGQVDLLISCPECVGVGVIDSGGSTPWGEWINLPCELCKGTGKTTEAEANKAGWMLGD
jgi:DnaJ-class molecular chaperone